MKRSVTLFVLSCLIGLCAVSATVCAQTTTRVSTAHVDFGTLAGGGSAERDVILTNPANNSTVRYAISFTNLSGASRQLTATPSSGSIGSKSNVTIAVRLDVPSDATEGNFSSHMIVNESKVPNIGGNSTALPALTAQVTYVVKNNPPVFALSNVDVPLVAAVLGVFAVLAVVAVYLIFRKP